MELQYAFLPFIFTISIQAMIYNTSTRWYLINVRATRGRGDVVNIYYKKKDGAKTLILILKRFFDPYPVQEIREVCFSTQIWGPANLTFSSTSDS